MPQVLGFTGGVDAQHDFENFAVGGHSQLASDQFARRGTGKARQVDGLPAREAE